MLLAEPEAYKVWDLILDDLGIARGDTVYLGVGMANVPLPRHEIGLSREEIFKREEHWCAFVVEVLRKKLGSKGTILVPTYTYAYTKGIPYIHEASPSETGPFTEYLRRHADSRSLHPVHSVAGIGLHAKTILDNTGRAAFGARSPYMRFKDHGVKFLCLGATMGESLTYTHHLEHLYGVNYRYNKIFNTPVFRDGVEQPGPWLCFSRFLGVGVDPALINAEHGLRKAGKLGASSRWHYPMQVASVKDVDSVIFDMLDADPFAFTREPVEIQIESPGSVSKPGNVRIARFELCDEKIKEPIL